MVPYTAAFHPGLSKMTMLGGVLLILHYGLQVFDGLLTHHAQWNAMTSPMGKFDGTVFALSLGTIAVALLSILLTFLGFLNNFKYFALISSLIGLAAAMTGLFTLWVDQPMEIAFTVGAVSVGLSATLVGISALRSNLFPQRVRVAFIFLGPITCFLWQSLSSLNSFLSAWFWVELHFLPMGILLVYIGLHLQQIKRVGLS